MKTRLVGFAAFGLGVVLAFAAPAHWVFRAPVEVAVAAAGEGFACPMFCVVLDDLPADPRCPVCGMVLGSVASEAVLDQHERWIAGVETAPLERLPLERRLRLVAEVEPAEDRLATVSARTGLFVEVLHATRTFAEVQEGEVLAEVFGAELVSAQRELLLAREGRGELLAAARRRLEWLGIHPEDVAELEAQGEVRRRLPLRAPRAGTLLRRRVVEGRYAAAGAELFVIANLDQVWVQVETLEEELAQLAPGRAVDWRDPTRGMSGTARIEFADPVLDRARRAGRARFRLDNPADEAGVRPFRPGQRLEVLARVPLDRRGRPTAREPEAVLAIPRSALLSSGRRDVVFVLFADFDDGRSWQASRLAGEERVGYEMVEVRVGPLAVRADSETLEAYYPLLEVVLPPVRIDPETGADASALALTRLEEGHALVARGALLLDSQAQISGRPSAWFPGGRTAAPQPDAHAGH